MALESTRTIAELKEECENRNLTVIPTGKSGKYLKEDFIKALRADYLVERFGELEDVPFPLRFMLTMDCPMLCKRYAAIKKQDVQISLWKNDGKYAAEEKIDGSRSILIYDAERHEFDFFSRHNSVSDFLPISYKDTILVHGNYRGDTSFVLDCEVISTNANVTTKKTCTSQLNSTSAILALDPVQSREIQKNNPLMFVVFDCLYNGVDIRSLPWKDRHVHAEKLAKALSDAGFMCKINPYVLENKKEFYENLIKQGAEGCVFKRTDAPYSSTTSRTDDMVKLKRTVACDLASDIDAWVSGFTEATKGKANENYIGGLIFSCKVKLKNGETVIREIGRVAGIPQDLRVEMTDYDANGNPKLKQSYYGRVATISGQDISGVNKRLTHCVLKAWRYDKDPSGCEVLSEEELDKLIM